MDDDTLGSLLNQLKNSTRIDTICEHEGKRYKVKAYWVASIIRIDLQEIK